MVVGRFVSTDLKGIGGKERNDAFWDRAGCWGRSKGGVDDYPADGSSGQWPMMAVSYVNRALL